MKWTLLVAGLLVAGGLAFGAMGGEYSTLNWWQLKREVRGQLDAIARLEGEIDSLEAWAVQIETDAITQERVARERFGMIRNGETLYRVEPGR
jgi:cell division protein FtsB